MRRNRFDSTEARGFSWRALALIAPYLLEYRGRIVFALGCLVAAKIGNIWAPFLLKHAVDAMGSNRASWLVVAVGMVVAYGMARLVNVMFGEIRDTLFGRVTERAMRRVGLRVFEHLHGLDLDFHLERRTGGLARDIERGTNGISFLMRFFVFNIAPTLVRDHGGRSAAGVELRDSATRDHAGAVLAYIAFSASSPPSGAPPTCARPTWRIRRATRWPIDSLLNYETVKYFGNEAHEIRRYDAELAGGNRRGARTA
jgi:ABC-type multidrug transport system fused ATPase/permease subunit